MMTGKWIIAGIITLGGLFGAAVPGYAQPKVPIKAIYIPLADHYPGIIAYEKYHNQTKEADYTIEPMKSWGLLRAYFLSGEADLAFIISPMAMDMFDKSPNFRWISLIHRDGNALAINDLMNTKVGLSSRRSDRKPDAKVAKAFVAFNKEQGEPVQVGVPSLLATHTVVLYKYLKDHQATMGVGHTLQGQDVLAIEVPPPKSPSFIKQQNSRGIPAAFEQSLPWADVVETQGFGKVAWYSRDVLKWPKGHVECIIIATDDAIKNKRAAVAEVVRYIHQAGIDIEDARNKGGQQMHDIAALIRKHIPAHNEDAIIQSLNPDLNVINYKNLNVDKPGIKQVMDLAVEAGVLNRPINIDQFTDDQFSTAITRQ